MQRSAVRRKNTVKKNLISIYFALVLSPSLTHSLTCVSHISQGCGMWNGNESVQFEDHCEARVLFAVYSLSSTINWAMLKQ